VQTQQPSAKATRQRQPGRRELPRRWRPSPQRGRDPAARAEPPPALRLPPRAERDPAARADPEV